MSTDPCNVATGVAAPWFEPARLAASSLGAWLELERELQWRAAAECGENLTRAWSEAAQAGTPDAWWAAAAQLWSRQSALAWRRSAEFASHLLEARARWGEFQHEEWVGMVGRWLAPPAAR